MVAHQRHDLRHGLVDDQDDAVLPQAVAERDKVFLLSRLSPSNVVWLRAWSQERLAPP